MPEPTPEERVTRALQRAHWSATRHAEQAGEQLERVTLQHRSALQAVADHLAEVRALADALAQRGAPTLAEERARAEERNSTVLHSTLHGGTLTVGRLVAAGARAIADAGIASDTAAARIGEA
jgi:hypothetical protein